MTELNTDYNNTELLDQELTTAELSEVSGGNPDLTRTTTAIQKYLGTIEISGDGELMNGGKPVEYIWRKLSGDFYWSERNGRYLEAP